MMRAMKWMGAALVVSMVPGLALAQGRDEPRRGLRGALPATERNERGMWRDITVMAQGGVLTYTGEAARLTTPGAAYGVLAGVDVLPWLDAELSYQGAAYKTQEDLSPDQSTLLENGGQAVAKVGPDRWRLEPYALGGIAVSRLSVVGEPAPGVPVQDATLVKLPLGVGVDWKVPLGDGESDLNIGARATYDIALDSGAFPTLEDTQSSNQLQGVVHLGASF